VDEDRPRTRGRRDRSAGGVVQGLRPSPPWSPVCSTTAASSIGPGRHCSTGTTPGSTSSSPLKYSPSCATVRRWYGSTPLLA